MSLVVDVSGGGDEWMLIVGLNDLGKIMNQWFREIQFLYCVCDHGVGGACTCVFGKKLCAEKTLQVLFVNISRDEENGGREGVRAV